MLHCSKAKFGLCFRAASTALTTSSIFEAPDANGRLSLFDMCSIISVHVMSPEPILKAATKGSTWSTNSKP